MKKIETSNSAILEAIAEYTICNADMGIEITDIDAVEKNTCNNARCGK